MTDIPLEKFQPIVDGLQEHIEDPNQIEVVLVLNGSAETGLLAMNVWTRFEGHDAQDRALELVRHALNSQPIEERWQDLPPELHDTRAHIEAGAFGAFAPGCDRCAWMARRDT